MNETTEYVGRDYGLGQSNRDKSNGIRNGVIPQDSIGEAWYDSSEPYYGKPTCPKCGNEANPVKGQYDRYKRAGELIQPA